MEITLSGSIKNLFEFSLRRLVSDISGSSLNKVLRENSLCEGRIMWEPLNVTWCRLTFIRGCTPHWWALSAYLPACHTSLNVDSQAATSIISCLTYPPALMELSSWSLPKSPYSLTYIHYWHDEDNQCGPRGLSFSLSKAENSYLFLVNLYINIFPSCFLNVIYIVEEKKKKRATTLSQNLNLK